MLRPYRIFPIILNYSTKTIATERVYIEQEQNNQAFYSKSEIKETDYFS